MWQKIARPLQSTKHPIIIPDMLGYGGTDKPSDPAAYSFGLMTKDMTEILDAESVPKCISIGHDWGSTAATRLAQYHPERVAGIVNINVPYSPLVRESFDLDAFNAFTKQVFGYGLWTYWYFFTAPDAPAVLKSDLDRLFTILHSSGTAMKSFFCEDGVMRDALEHKTNPDIPIRAYGEDPALRKAFIDRMTRDGFEGPLCWYRAMVTNVQYQSDSTLPAGRELINVPALYFGGSQDPVCRPEMMKQAVDAGLLPHLEHAGMMDAGHWTVYEKPGECVQKIEAWLKKNYAK
ncbi:uncharacterized protein SETTUDRAFT_164848 [Exserohilum turcica Et28A]|uniref:AB hydrolase-1 domain-containing protein n=1 Tax=Exserohilum turcicum (strain 28A) TaxID=671987 RepID=R0IEC2_EXST2|nr:uncharacterized protein SETTUDRAFT_164848 [Exserohilum turcica Et28A]EOA83491.1 hypothetical protein SETTUDRAFT_164848 [Exserohilum turcica Et28A]